MGKGANSQLLNNSATATGEAGTNFGNAANLFGTLSPQLTNQSINPQGMSPTDMAAQTTAAMQSAGGSAAGAAGQGKLYEQRTRNAGAAGNAIAAGAQNAQQNLGKQAVGVQVRNAGLKNQQQEHAESELGGLYGTTLGAGNTELGLSNQALGTENQYQDPWMKLLTAGIGSGAGYQTANGSGVTV